MTDLRGHRVARTHHLSLSASGVRCDKAGSKSVNTGGVEGTRILRTTKRLKGQVNASPHCLLARAGCGPRDGVKGEDGRVEGGRRGCCLLALHARKSGYRPFLVFCPPHQAGAAEVVHESASDGDVHTRGSEGLHLVHFTCE